MMGSYQAPSPETACWRSAVGGEQGRRAPDEGAYEKFALEERKVVWMRVRAN